MKAKRFPVLLSIAMGILLLLQPPAHAFLGKLLKDTPIVRDIVNAWEDARETVTEVLEDVIGNRSLAELIVDVTLWQDILLKEPEEALAVFIGKDMVLPPILAYEAFLESQADFVPLPPDMVRLIEDYYPDSNLDRVRVAQGVDTIHGMAITFDYSIYFPTFLDTLDGDDYLWLMHEIEHVNQYQKKGKKVFLVEYVARNVGDLVSSISRILDNGKLAINLHDDNTLERDADTKAEEVRSETFSRWLETDDARNGNWLEDGFYTRRDILLTEQFDNVADHTCFAPNADADSRWENEVINGDHTGAFSGEIKEESPATNNYLVCEFNLSVAEIQTVELEIDAALLTISSTVSSETYAASPLTIVAWDRSRGDPEWSVEPDGAFIDPVNGEPQWDWEVRFVDVEGVGAQLIENLVFEVGFARPTSEFGLALHFGNPSPDHNYEVLVAGAAITILGERQ